MARFSFTVNKEQRSVEASPDTPILWILRENLNLTGTKYACGMAQCGSCTIHMDGNPIRSCVTPISAVEDKELTTIEGLAAEGQHPLQKAWIEKQAPQCGYCQPGQIMQAAALIDKNPSPTREEIVNHMKGNLCRCGAYLRILNAIESVAEKRSENE